MRKSTQVALGGLSASLCLLLMFMTGLMPFATYSLPALAGVVLISVVIENGKQTAWIVYFAVSLLSVFVVPDKEAALIFIVFFGYYPIIKESLEKIKSKTIEYIAKFAIFNTSIILMYVVIIYVFGMSQLVAEMGDMGMYSTIGLLVLANITFILYDIMLTKLVIVYIKVLRPKILRKFKV